MTYHNALKVRERVYHWPDILPPCLGVDGTVLSCRTPGCATPLSGSGIALEEVHRPKHVLGWCHANLGLVRKEVVFYQEPPCSKSDNHAHAKVLTEATIFCSKWGLRLARAMLNGSGNPVELVGLRTCRWHGRWCHIRCGDGTVSLSLGCRFIHDAGGLSWVDVGWLVRVEKLLWCRLCCSGCGVVVGWRLVMTSMWLMGCPCMVWYIQPAILL